MSRIRSIKPEFWSSEQVMAQPRDARLMFIGLWNFADDAGRFRWSTRAIKAQIFPGDFDVTEAMIDTWLSGLVQGELLVQYRNGPGTYGLVAGWHHQKISHPQKPKYPAPIDNQSFRVDSVNEPGTLRVETSLIGSDLIGSDLTDSVPVVGPSEPANDFDRRGATALFVRQCHVRLMESIASFPPQGEETGKAHAALTKWASQFPDPERALRAAFYGFQADDWVAKRAYPISALVKATPRYHAAGLLILEGEAV